MGVDSDRSNRQTANRSVSKAIDLDKQAGVPTVRIFDGQADGLQLDYSKQAPEYSRRIAQKIVRAKIPSDTWTIYTCREGTVVQFASTEGTELGKTYPLRKMQVKILVDQKTVQRILIRQPQGPNGENIVPPSVVVKQDAGAPVRTATNNTPQSPAPGSAASVIIDSSPLAAKPLANWAQLKTKQNARKTDKPAAAKPIPDATQRAVDAIPLPKRSPGEPPSWAFDRTRPGASTFAANTWGVSNAAPKEWKWLTPSRAAEKQLREFLEERNGELHIQRRQTNEKRRQKREPLLEGSTWIDSFFQIAQQKFRELQTPLCRLAEVYLRPDYLSAPHTDKKSATKVVDRVVELLLATKKSRKSALRQFAAEVLERGQYKELDTIEVAGVTRKDLNQLTNQLADPKTSLSDGLRIILQDLSDSIHHEYDQMRKTGNENEKINSITKCRDALTQAETSKAFRNCTAEQREQLKGVINGWGDRITSYTNVNQLPQKRS